MSLSSIRKLVSFDISDGLQKPAEEMHADGRLTARTVVNPWLAWPTTTSAKFRT
jgi:hypothetical protein